MSNGQSTPSLKDLFGGKLPSLSKQKITDRLKKLDDEIDSLSKAEVKEMGEKIKDGLIQNSIQGLNVSPEIIKEKGDDIEPPYILLVEGPTASYKSTLSQDLVAKYLEKTSDKGYVAAYFTLEQPYKIFLKTIRKIPFLQPLLKLREEGRFDVIDYTEHEDVFATAHKLVMKYYSGYRKYVLKKQRDELNIQKGTGVTEDIARKYPVFIKKVWAEIEEKIDEKINADNILLKFRFRKLPPNEREAFINLVAEYVRRFLLYFPFIPMVKEYLNKYKHVDEQNIDSGQVIEILKDNGVSEEGLLETVWPLDKDEPQKPTLDEDYAISILAAINRLWIKHIPEKRKIQILNELIKDKEFSKKIKARYGNAYRTALKGSDGKYDLSKVTDLMPEDFRDDLFLEESNLKLVVIDSMPMIYEQLERQLDKNTMKSELSKFYRALRRRNLFVVGIDELTGKSRERTTYGEQAAYSADAIFTLDKNIPYGSQYIRTFRLDKLRQVKHSSAFYPLVSANTKKEVPGFQPGIIVQPQKLTFEKKGK